MNIKDVDKALIFACEKFNVEKPECYYNDLPQKTRGGYIPKRKIIILNQEYFKNNNFCRFNKLYVVFHEFIHYLQEINNELTDDNYKYKNFQEYINLPIEKDARSRGQSLLSKYKRFLYGEYRANRY